MKNILFITKLILSASLLFAQDSTESTTITNLETVTLTVNLEGLDSNEGLLSVGLYNSSENWLSNTIMGAITEIKNNSAVVKFENVPLGTYAISAYHDKNSNKQLDANALGIPKEPYANSRGAKGFFGPPKWNDAQFELTLENNTETIKF